MRRSKGGLPFEPRQSTILNSMPQFELENVGPEKISRLVRGRSVEEAIRRGGGIPENAEMTIDEHSDVQRWQEVVLDGEVSGRVRPHQRMRFRRD